MTFPLPPLTFMPSAVPWPDDYPDLSAPELAGLRRTLGAARLDGALPDAGTVALLIRVARGELTTEQVVAETHARIVRGELGDATAQEAARKRLGWD